MKLEELLTGIEYTTDADISDVDISYVSYDSRRVSGKSLFVALTGARVDGHNYAQLAYELGCRSFLLEHSVDLPDDAILIYTDNTRSALADLGQTFFGHPERSLRIIGITGTKGKTTTSLMIAAILGQAGIRCGYIGSNGVEFAGRHFSTSNTTPESYDIAHYFRLMVDEGVTHVVIEVSSQALFNYRVKGLEFDVCAFTNLYHDHIGVYEHPTFEHYKASKRKLFTDYGAKYIAYCADDPSAEYMIEGCGALCTGFAVAKDAQFTASDIEKYRDDAVLGIKFTLKANGWQRTVKLPTPGNFSVYNALCATAVASKYNIPADTIVYGLEHCTPKGRFEIVKALDYATFIIDYAHNGVSLKHALSVIREYKPNRLICLFGSVGERSKDRRAELATVAGELCDFAVISSDNPGEEPPMNIIADIEKNLPEGFPHVSIPSRREAIKYVVENAEPGDIILLAGKGHENYQLVRKEKVPFSERDLLLEFAKELKAEQAFKQYPDKQFV